MSTNCLFCRIAAGEVPATLVHQDDEVLAFEDVNPQAPTHILVIPRRHIASLNELGDDEARLAGRLVKVAADIATDRGIAARGYRAVFNCNDDGGQTVFHLHLHLLGGRRLDWPPG